IVISGGARGVTAEVAHSLAQSGQPTLLLLGRSELPDAEPAWLCATKSEADVKKAIMAHADQPMKPRQLNDACQSALNNRELLENIQRLEATGSKVLYRSVDIRDEQAVNEIIQQVSQCRYSR
ncbi:MAG: KR domain-containing protein, partial [Deltaproteobacteria bacterium]|nr:KR domain-containing protein [Deltaproteobacteria bacterium]